jgi:hypothetical protein
MSERCRRAAVALLACVLTGSLWALGAQSAQAATSFTLTGVQSCTAAGVPHVTWTITFQSDSGQQLQTGQSARTDIAHADGTSATVSGPSAFFFLQLDPGQSRSGTTAAAVGDTQTQTVTASFQPEGGLQSTQATVHVRACPTTTNLDVRPGSTTTVGKPVGYFATVGPAPVGGTITFSDGGAAIPGCTAIAVTASPAVCIVTYSTPGTHEVTATYSGTTTLAGSTSAPVSVTVVGPPPKPVATTTELTVSPGATTGTPVTYTATVDPTPGGGTVSFTDGGTAIPGCGSVAANPMTGVATCTVTYGAPGPHDVTATYSGTTAYEGSTSGPLSVTVASPPPPPPAAPTPGGTTAGSTAPTSSAAPVLAATGVEGAPLVGLGLLLVLIGTTLRTAPQLRRR